MKLKKKEVRGMTDKQYILQSLKDLEAYKIIAEQAKSAEEVKNALDRIQGVLKSYIQSTKTK